MMRKFSIAILLFLLTGVASKAQQVLYSQTFEDTTNLFQEYVLSNLDNGDPAGTEWDTLKSVPWFVGTAGIAGNHAAIGTSKYDPAKAADDWFITPAIRLGEMSFLNFKSLSLVSGTTDTYQLFVSTTEQSVSGCLFNPEFFSFSSSQTDAFLQHSLNLSSLYANKVVYIGFRLNTASGGDKLAIDDIEVTDDVTPFKSLTFEVNMSKYIADSLFNPRADTVDVAGTFNKYDGTKHILHIVPGSDSSIYSITIPGFRDGDHLEFKFRINSSWHDSIVEFPYGQPNRQWNVESGKYTYSCFYNNAESGVSKVPDNSIMSLVNVFPNPAQNQVFVELPENIQRLMLISFTGNKIKESGIISDNRFAFDVSNLSNGTYLLLFYDEKGFVGSKKLIKN
jgi:hypothetical protein